MSSMNVTSKDIVKDLLNRLPDEISLHQIAREIDFVAAVRQGMGDLDNGEEVSVEEVEQELSSWIIK